MKNIYIGSDHAGFELKGKMIAYILSRIKPSDNCAVIDVGCSTKERCDFPTYAHKLCQNITEDENINTNQNKENQNEKYNEKSLGVLICGSGIGMSMAANRFPKIRCALCYNTYAAKMARNHTDANVLALGERVIGVDLAKDIVKTFLTEKFLGGRYAARVAMLTPP